MRITGRVPDLRRRQLLCALAHGAASVVLAQVARARGSEVQRVGALMLWHAKDAASVRAALEREMSVLRRGSGIGLDFDWRFAQLRVPDLPALARELVRGRPQALVGWGDKATMALAAETAEIPIVSTIGDPIRLGLSDSVSRPSRNITGQMVAHGGIQAKLLEYMRIITQGRLRLSIVLPSHYADSPYVSAYRDEARREGIDLLVFLVGSREDFVKAIDAASRDGIGALIAPYWFTFEPDGRALAALLLRRKLAWFDDTNPVARFGGLLAYLPDPRDMLPRLARQLERLLRGASVGEVPFEQPTRFRLEINGRTAAALGLNVPANLMLLADAVHDSGTP